MADVSVPAQDADRLTRGGVCAKTGAIATRTISMRVVHTPGWIWILLLFGILPFIIVYAFTKKELRVEIPAAAEVVRQRVGIFTKMWVAVGMCVALVAAGVIFESATGVWIGLGGLVAALMALPFGARVWINASFDGELVHLSRVHPNYAAAVEGSS